MSNEKKKRVFVAIKTPPEWSATLLTIQENLRSQFHGAKVKWVSPEQFHITLRFFGYLASPQVEQVSRLLVPACADITPASLYYTGLGCFPRPSAPRVLWAGVAEKDAILFQLQEKINALTGDIGQAPEKRDFHLHITLARISELPRKFRQQWVQALEGNQFKPRTDWVVREIILMESQLDASGAHYSALASAPLQ